MGNKSARRPHRISPNRSKSEEEREIIIVFDMTMMTVINREANERVRDSSERNAIGVRVSGRRRRGRLVVEWRGKD